MSFGAPGGRAISIKPIPPERGSFPLDHDAECKHIISSYLKCLRKARVLDDSTDAQAGINDEECRLIAKDYLQCRMDKNLMAKDEMKNLGLEFSSQFKKQRSEETESAEMPREK